MAFVLTGGPSSTASPLAALLRSGGGARLRLVGGLKLPHLHHAYLVGGAPFLALPEGIEERTFLLDKDEQQPPTHVRGYGD